MFKALAIGLALFQGINGLRLHREVSNSDVELDFHICNYNRDNELQAGEEYICWHSIHPDSKIDLQNEYGEKTTKI